MSEIPLKNLSVNIKEEKDVIRVEVKAVLDENKERTEKRIEIEYKPYDHNERGEFFLVDVHNKVAISRGYPVMNGEDTEWEVEDVYPCGDCENAKGYRDMERDKREVVEKENSGLRKIIRELANLLH